MTSARNPTLSDFPDCGSWLAEARAWEAQARLAWQAAVQADGLRHHLREAAFFEAAEKLGRLAWILKWHGYRETFPPEAARRAWVLLRETSKACLRTMVSLASGVLPDVKDRQEFVALLDATVAQFNSVAEMDRMLRACRPQEQAPQPRAPGKSKAEVTKELLRLRDAGEPFTTYEDMATRVGASSGNVHNAVKETPALQEWAKKPEATPRAQTMTEVVTDSVADERSPDPAQDTEDRELLRRVEELDPQAREWLRGLSREQQLAYLDDPDRFPQILGRKP
jgi:hypothetical protein